MRCSLEYGTLVPTAMTGGGESVNSTIPEDYSELRALYTALLEENERLRDLLRRHGLEEPVLSTHMAVCNAGGSEQLRMEIPDDSSGSNAIIDDSCHGAETGFSITKRSNLQDKIALFKLLFMGRPDVYAYRWTNKKGASGYSPACQNQWMPGVCGKPKIKCADCPNPNYLPFDDSAVERHLSGKQVIGAYAILSDDTCHFLAIDFDEETWKEDVLCLSRLCGDMGIPHSIEISRSGNGSHFWFFFSETIEASLCRRFATRLLEACMQQNPRMTFKSFDRMFPNQDTMPKGGFGNLIALPLQKEAAQKVSESLFVDENYSPYPDQWAYLSDVRRLSRDDINHHMTKMGVSTMPAPETSTDTEKPWDRKSELLPESDGTRQIVCVLANRLYIETKALSARAQNQLKRIATFSNPEFYRKQAMRQHIPLGTPRVICCAEYDGDYLCLPRGCLDDVASWTEKNHLTMMLTDERTTGRSIDVAFNGELREEQKPAFDALNRQDCGVLSATTAFGKTVIGAALIAEKQVNTLIIVQRKQLMEQWQERLNTFLSVNEALPLDEQQKKRGRKKKRDIIGVYGAGKDTRSGIIDIAIQQSLGKMDDVKEWIKDYGMVIVDECHHVPAPTFEQVLQKVSAKYFYGLSATPNRKDGHHPILKMYLGDIRYKVDARTEAKKRPFEHVMIPRFTGTAFASGGKTTITQLYARLAEDDLRNHLIVDDVIACAREERNCLILSERKQHVLKLAELIAEQGFQPHVLFGGKTGKEAKKQNDELRNAAEPLIICATGKYVGEGFDESRLDTLFLTMPISWQGTLAQYAGRLHRLHEGKSQVRVYDYIDSKSEMLERMYQKRQKGYASLGYSVGTAEVDSRDIIYDGETFMQPLLADIHSAGKSIIISSPYVRAGQLRMMEPSLTEAIRRGINVEIHTKDGEAYRKTAQVIDRVLASITGARIHRAGDVYLKFIVIDGRLVWYGSIDVLGSVNPKDSIMRLTSGSIAKSLLEKQ